MACQPFTTTATKASVFAQALWSEREATRSGYLGRQPHPRRGAERHAGDVRSVNVERGHEPGDIVGKLLH
jgi:hypothetical protein